MATTQQLQCYAAQESLGTGRRFTSIDEVQRFVDGLRDEPWWTAQGYHLKVLRIEVGRADGRVLRKANGVAWWDADMGAGRIELRPNGMTERTVCHEVAHVLSRAVHGSQSHDPWWARTYLTLVSCVMGPEAYLTLQRAFDEQGVDYDVRTVPESTFAL